MTSTFPTPGKRLRGSRWQVYWWAKGRSFHFSAGRVTEAEAESIRLQTALALVFGLWPSWAAS